MPYHEDESNPSWVLTSPQTLTLLPRPLPKLVHPTDLLLHITHTGICGSDLHYLLHHRLGPFTVTAPLILGHESSGTIISHGPGTLPQFSPGTRVAIEPGIPCRYCQRCKAGRYNLCEGMKFAATPPVDGTLAKYVVMPADMCIPLPETVSSEEGAMLEPLAVGVHVMRSQAAVSPGEVVVVMGAGPVGLLCAAVAKARGAAEVVVVDVVKSRLEFVKGLTTCGGIETFHSAGCKDSSEVVEGLKERFGGLRVGGGAHKAVDATGVEVCIQSAIGVLRPGGTFVQAGMGRDLVQVPMVEVAAKEIVVKGSFRYAAGDYEEALRLVKDQLVDVRGLITHRFKFTEAVEAFETVKRGEGVKVIIEGARD
ncbi:xylitol dehydrogenase [Ascodesmis nigricans]|uniref:Xylitol dehydrogenase n=1 Tax=Ascodesmis nigricans TaxID=341454 RepID=A0A4S2MUN3_9PEZI|nr:xylitol dehydrogenase [Ascodesmis nigricans]